MLGDISSVTSINNKSCYIFATNYGNRPYGNANGVRVFNAKITLNNSLVRDFIPVLDKMGVPCLYDKVEDKFYYNENLTNVKQSNNNLDKLNFITSLVEDYNMRSEEKSVNIFSSNGVC